MNVIWDLDGTLTNASPFDYLLDTKPKQWDEWNKNTFHHEPWKPMVDRYADHFWINHNNHIITARAENCRIYTENWLRKHNLDCMHSGLYMRRKGDRRPDFIIKEEIIFTLRKKGIEFSRAYDDRLEVVEMYRRNGIDAIHVVNGTFLSP